MYKGKKHEVRNGTLDLKGEWLEDLSKIEGLDKLNTLCELNFNDPQRFVENCLEKKMEQAKK